MEKYEESLKIYRDNYNTLEYAKKEGRIQGREEDRLQGRLEGREEVKIEMAKAMKKNGIAIELIAELSGLSRAEIEQLDS